MTSNIGSETIIPTSNGLNLLSPFWHRKREVVEADRYELFVNRCSFKARWSSSADRIFSMWPGSSISCSLCPGRSCTQTEPCDRTLYPLFGSANRGQNFALLVGQYCDFHFPSPYGIRSLKRITSKPNAASI